MHPPWDQVTLFHLITEYPGVGSFHIMKWTIKILCRVFFCTTVSVIAAHNTYIRQSPPLFFKLFVVRILLITLNRWRTFIFHNVLIWFVILDPSFIAKYTDLTVKEFLSSLFQITSSWSCVFNWRPWVMR
jgi:hypothetical protein